jgi:hypothetical protein
MSCYQCEKDHLQFEESADGVPINLRWTERFDEPTLLELTDDGAYVGACRRGHPFKFTIENLRYEVLYESGVMAMLCGFHREAVSSVATALERFFEFSIHVLLAHQGVNHDDSLSSWNEVATSSERQLGAFLFLYLAVLKKPFRVVEGRRPFRKMTEFRNTIIHKGGIPSCAQAEEYAQDIYEIVRSVGAELSAVNKTAVDAIKMRMGRTAHTIAMEKKASPDHDYQARGLARIEMMLSDFRSTGPTDFKTRLTRSREMMKYWGLVPSRS